MSEEMTQFQVLAWINVCKLLSTLHDVHLEMKENQ